MSALTAVPYVIWYPAKDISMLGSMLITRESYIASFMFFYFRKLSIVGWITYFDLLIEMAQAKTLSQAKAPDWKDCYS